MCIVQMLLGNIGVPGGGINALRGHSNIQGLTDLGLLSELMPGYMDLPTDRDRDIDGYMARHQFKPLRPGQTSYWQNYSKFFVSFMKAMYGKAAMRNPTTSPASRPADARAGSRRATARSTTTSPTAAAASAPSGRTR